jgi:hypothetical protein
MSTKSSSKPTEITTMAELHRFALDFEGEGDSTVVVVSVDVLKQVEADTVRHDANPRIAWTASAVNNQANLMANGEYTTALKGSVICIRRRSAGLITIPEGLTRVRGAIQNAATTRSGVSVPFRLRSVTKEEEEVILRYGVEGRPRSLDLRCKLSDRLGVPLPAGLNSKAVKIAKYVLGVFRGDHGGQYTPTPGVIEDAWGTKLRDPVLSILNVPGVKGIRIAVPAALAYALHTLPTLSNETIQFATYLGNHIRGDKNPKDVSHARRLATWIVKDGSKAATTVFNGQSGATKLFRGVTYRLRQHLLEEPDSERTFASGDYLLNLELDETK